MNAASSTMLKNGAEPISCRPTMTCTALAPRFSSAKEPRWSSSLSPSEVTTACGCTVNMTFGGALATVTLLTSDTGPVFVGSHPGTARTRW